MMEDEIEMGIEPNCLTIPIELITDDEGITLPSLQTVPCFLCKL